MTQEQLLLELKDINPPGEPGWWLIAPGYLFIVALILFVIATCWIVMRRRESRRKYATARLALEQIRSTHLENEDPLKLARELAQWLKQVALIAFPQSQLEGVTGSTWLAFLDSSLDDGSFTRGDGNAFADAVYQRQAKPDAEQLLSLCERWLAAVKPQLLQRGQG